MLGMHDSSARDRKLRDRALAQQKLFLAIMDKLRPAARDRGSSRAATEAPATRAAPRAMISSIVVPEGAGHSAAGPGTGNGNKEQEPSRQRATGVAAIQAASAANEGTTPPTSARDSVAVSPAGRGFAAPQVADQPG